MTRLRSWFRARPAVLLLAAAVTVAAAGLAAAQAPAPRKLKVALVLAGMVSDKGFNAGAYNGLVRIKDELGFETAFSEGVARGDMVTAFRDYASRGFDVIIGHGFPTADALARVAGEFPKQHFLNTFGDIAGKNIAVLECRWEDLFHIMGYLTGLVSPKGKVGIVGGWEAPGIRLQVESFRQGVLDSRPSADVQIIYTGTFYDPVKGKEAARALIGQGVDTLAHMADQSGLGVIEAAREANLKAVGYFEDQRKLAPEHVISSAVIRSGDMLFLMVKNIADGKFQAGRHVFGLKEGVLQVGPYGAFVSASVREKTNALVEDVKSGKRKIPSIDVKELMKAKIRKL
jgi:basic membrane protein A